MKSQICHTPNSTRSWSDFTQSIAKQTQYKAFSVCTERVTLNKSIYSAQMSICSPLFMMLVKTRLATLSISSCWLKVRFSNKGIFCVCNFKSFTVPSQFCILIRAAYWCSVIKHCEVSYQRSCVTSCTIFTINLHGDSINYASKLNNRKIVSCWHVNMKIFMNMFWWDT